MPTPRKPEHLKKRKGPARGNAVASPEVMAKHQQAADLAVQGFSYTEIAKQLDYRDPSAARYAVNAHFKRAATETAEHLRPRMVARAELMWRHGIAAMLEGRANDDVDQFSKGAVAADRALGRLMTLHGFAGPGVTVQQVNVGAEASSLDQLKAEFTALLAAGQAFDGEVVEASDTP